MYREGGQTVLHSPNRLSAHVSRCMKFCTRFRSPGCAFSNGCRTGCTIRLVSDGPELVSSSPARERNWVPLAIAAAAVVVVAGLVFFMMQRGAGKTPAAPVNPAADPYAANLPISNLQMSESS